jgi:hypothetical protein
MEDDGNRNVGFVIRTALVLLLALAVAGAVSDRSSAAFLGLNGRIAYSYSDAGEDSIGSADADGGAALELTSDSGDHGPIYSADGGRIVFERGNGVAVMNADGSQVRQLLDAKHVTESETKWLQGYETPAGETVPFVKVETEVEPRVISKARPSLRTELNLLLSKRSKKPFRRLSVRSR